eukprot:s1352_g6.t1
MQSLDAATPAISLAEVQMPRSFAAAGQDRELPQIVLWDRTISSLKFAHRIAAESMQIAEALLHRPSALEAVATPKLVSFYAHNEAERTGELLSALRQGEAVAIVPRAGTPAVCDPGRLLVQAAHREGFPVKAIPGPCSLHPKLNQFPPRRHLRCAVPVLAMEGAPVALHSGWLQVLEAASWEDRWCIVRSGVLELFDDETCSRRRGSVPLGPSSHVSSFDLSEDSVDSEFSYDGEAPGSQDSGLRIGRVFYAYYRQTFGDRPHDRCPAEATAGVPLRTHTSQLLCARIRCLDRTWAMMTQTAESMSTSWSSLPVFTLPWILQPGKQVLLIQMDKLWEDVAQAPRAFEEIVSSRRSSQLVARSEQSTGNMLC